MPRRPTRRPRVRVRDLRCGGVVTVRRVLDQLGPSSLARRFHAPVGALTGRLVAAIAVTDGRSRLVVVADVRGERRVWRPVGLCEVVATGRGEAEVAMCVADAWQGRGIARRLAEVDEHVVGVVEHQCVADERGMLVLWLADRRRPRQVS